MTEPPKPEPGAKATHAVYSLPAGSKITVGYGATTLFPLNLTGAGGSQPRGPGVRSDELRDGTAANLFQLGAIFSHVRELDGVKLGDPFAGEASALPTHKRWKHDWFIGVGIDLRSGVKLLRAVLGTAGGS